MVVLSSFVDFILRSGSAETCCRLREPRPTFVAHTPLFDPLSFRCREAFKAFDVDRSGTIDVWELRQVLEAMGQSPTEEELFQMVRCNGG